ncbi:MAG TPA: hypothetical protein VFI52_17035 [Gemmatimonadaceae bacterium]|nr:hypothetical protein [Gemmatimonadaceae bacterium]
MTDDVRDRFLAGIAAQLPVDRVKELHLFGAIRQGGTESGVAVVAVERESPITVDVDGGFVPPAAVAEAAPVETKAEVAVEETLADESRFVADEVIDETTPDVELPSEPVAAPAPAAPARYVVYTARYRLTLKGMDRGKWEMSVTEEADAPLITVDAVVRGVSRRSGDADETVRLSGDEFRAALPATAQPARA